MLLLSTNTTAAPTSGLQLLQQQAQTRHTQAHTQAHTKSRAHQLPSIIHQPNSAQDPEPSTVVGTTVLPTRAAATTSSEARQSQQTRDVKRGSNLLLGSHVIVTW